MVRDDMTNVGGTQENLAVDPGDEGVSNNLLSEITPHHTIHPSMVAGSEDGNNAMIGLRMCVAM